MKPVELVERPQFEADVHRAVAATYGEWPDAVAGSLEDAVQAYRAFEPGSSMKTLLAGGR